MKNRSNIWSKWLLAGGLLILFGVMMVIVVYSLRISQARNRVAADRNQRVEIIPPLETTEWLEILPLYEEASASTDLMSGHGVSYLVRTEQGSLIFDLGDNPMKLDLPPYLANMQALGIAWGEIDKIVISHPHPDHVGGVDAWRNQTLALGFPVRQLAERLVFIPTDLDFPGGIHATIATLPLMDVGTTGVIPYLESYPFTIKQPLGQEQALVIHVAGQGLVLVTACGHPGLAVLLDRAEQIYGEEVVAIVGGLHYESSSSAQLIADIRLLEKHGVQRVSLSPHDSSPEAIEVFRQEFHGQFDVLRVGEPVSFR